MVLEFILVSEQFLSTPTTIAFPVAQHQAIDPQLYKAFGIKQTQFILPISSNKITETAQSVPGTPPSAPSTEKPPAAASDEKPLTDDELFQRTFGRPRPKGTQQIPVPFYINGQEQGQLIILLAPGGLPAVRFQATPFLKKVTEFVRSDVVDKLTASIDPEGNLSLEALRQAGLEAVFDERRLELQVQVPAAQRRNNVIGGQLGLPPEAKNALLPSPVSGYINLRGGQDFIWSSETTQTGRQPFRLSLDGALNVRGWVLEGFANFTERGNPSWRRGDVRLVRDDPANAIRYVAGDLAVPVTGYQTSIPMFGVTAARNFSLQPYVITRPISEFQFFLEQPSRVEVYTNGRLVQVLQLQAGPQDIRNLPLATGLNDVQLVITDPVGRVQRLDFSSVVGGNLLAPGLQQFAYSFGFPSKDVRGNRDYDWSDPILTISHRLGLTSNLTLGSYFQGDVHQQVLGFEGIWVSAIGNFGWDTAVSRANDVGADFASRLRYEFVQAGYRNPSNRTFGLALEYRGANFTTLGSLIPKNDTGLDLTAYYGQKLFWDINGRVNLRYQFGRESPDAYLLSLGLSKVFRNGLSVSLNLSQSVDKTGQDEQRAFINLYWLFPKTRQSVQASTDIRSTQGPSNRVTWNYSSRRTVEDINASVGLETSEDRYNLTGDFSYTGYRAQIELFQDVGFPQGDGAVQSLSRFTFGSALVFAGGQFGWSRPVTNSFALITRRQNLKGQKVGVKIAGDDYIARADALGGAVVPDLQAYRVSTLRLEAPDLPQGAEFGQDVFHLLTTYKSGTLIRIGTEATVFIRGVLLDAKGNPVSLKAGEVRSLSDSNWQPLTLFTNRMGRFGVAGFKPGRYELRFLDNPQATLQFEIPEGKSGVYDLGNLRLPVVTQE
jgi:outer membrane usher protein